MLRKDLRYVCIDFETTGLDPEHDEAIQIGIVSFDHSGKELDSFSSYIKPQKSLTELKDMVRVITGLSINDISEAPSFAEIMPSVHRFFTDNTVIIGHNVQFDLKVLQQHMKVSTHAIMDTFPLAQSLMPFSPSYALEVLYKSITTKQNNGDAEISGEHHDALYDANATKRVFLHCMDRLTKLVEAYPHVHAYIARSSSPLSRIVIPSDEKTLDGSVPTLTKIMQSGKRLVSDDTLSAESFTDKGNYYIGNNSLKDTLKKLPKENVIFAFSQRHKTYIAKNILHEIGLTHIDTGGHFVFDKKLLSLFFHKKKFDEQELFFAIKYYFHAFSEHSTIDLNSPADWKIYHALKEKKSKGETKSAEILTHEQLYEKLREQDIMPYTNIFFFDQDWRYDTHMKWEQKPFDLYTLLQITESLIYRDQLLSTKESAWTPLHTKLVIFIGIWQTEVAGLLKDVSNSSVEIDSIIDNTYFYKTNLLLGQLSETIHQLEGKVADDDWVIIQEKRKRFREIIAGVCTITTKLHGDEIHFIVKTTNSFLEYSEFKQLFEIYHTSFLSILKKDWPTIGGSQAALSELLTLENRPGKEQIRYDKHNIYIFSAAKQISQDLLVWLHSHKPQKHKVHGENITGGKGKNIFAIKSSPDNVIIGGYDFFLQCVAQKIKIDIIYALAMQGPLQHIISADLLYYGNCVHA